jgi:hypothetical protein
MSELEEIERKLAELDRQLHAVREWVLHVERRLDRWIRQVRPRCGPQGRGLE